MPGVKRPDLQERRADAVDVGLKIPGGDPAERNNTVFSAFALADHENAGLKIDGVGCEVEKFLLPHSRRVEDFHDNPVAVAHDGPHVGRAKHLLDFRDAEDVAGKYLRHLGVLNMLGRIVGKDSLGAEIPQKHHYTDHVMILDLDAVERAFIVERVCNVLLIVEKVRARNVSRSLDALGFGEVEEPLNPRRYCVTVLGLRLIACMCLPVGVEHFFKSHSLSLSLGCVFLCVRLISG